MSFYLGENALGEKQLHITKGVSSLSELQGPAINNTVFHSDLPYVTVKHVADPTITTASGQYVQGYALSIDSTTKSLLVDGYLFFVLLSTTNFPGTWTLYSPAPYWTAMYNGAWNNSYSSCFSSSTVNSSSNATQVPTSNTAWFHISSTLGYEQADWFPLTITEAKILVLNIKNGTHLPLVKTNNEVVLSGSVFSVGGNNLNQIQYLSSGNVNSLDMSFVSRGTQLQLVNNTQLVGGFNVTSSNGSTEVSYSGKVLFSTEAAGVRAIYDKYLSFNIPGGVYTAPNTSTDRYFDLTPAGSYQTDSLIIFGISGLVNAMSGNYSINKFKVGYISPVGFRIERVYNSGLLRSEMYEIADLYGTADGKLQLRYTAVSNTAIGGNITSIPWSGWVHNFK